MISVQQLLPETRASADYSDTVAAAVASGLGRAVHTPPHTRDLQPLGSVFPQQTGGESEVRLPQLLCWIELKDQWGLCCSLLHNFLVHWGQFAGLFVLGETLESFGEFRMTE